jgi:hypothetical protein
MNNKGKNNHQLSYRKIAKYLKEKYNCEDGKQKERYRFFQETIGSGYQTYRKKTGHANNVISIDCFAEKVCGDFTAKRKTSDINSNIQQNAHFLISIIDTAIDNLIQTHHANNHNDVGDSTVESLKNIIYFYHKHANQASQRSNLHLLYLRVIDQMVSGITLISEKKLPEAAIIYRALLETLAYAKVMKDYGSSVSGSFNTRKRNVLGHLNIVTLSSQEENSIQKQSMNRANASEWSWEVARFAWIKPVFPKDKNITSQTLLEFAGLAQFYSHYQLASIFTHEYLVNEADFKIISLKEYLINIYWKTFDEKIRVDVKEAFALEAPATKDIEKREKAFRDSLAATKEKFQDFNRRLSS